MGVRIALKGEMGVTLHTGDLDFGDIVRYAREAEALGYEGFWVTEENGKEAFCLLSMLAQATTRIRLATGIVNFYSRSPMSLAMGASTIYRLSGGRFALGLGTGGVGFTVRGHGMQIEKPVARARESLEIVRGFLTQKRFSYQGRWLNVRDFHLREGPLEGELPIYLAALGPQMVRAAARHYDGFIMNWPSDEAIAEYRSLASSEASKAGRDPKDVKILTLLMTVGDPTDAASVDAMRRGLAFYCASPHYLHIAEVSGLGRQARKVKEVWEARDYTAAARLVTDQMVEKLSLCGTLEQCRKRLRSMIDGGVYPIIYPVPRHDRVVDDHIETARLAASYLE
jgi:5,10-methylenetetrahydromethanopterin reductase